MRWRPCEREGAGGEAKAGVPYAQYDVTVKMKSVGLITNEEEIADYAHGARVMQRTKRMLEANYHADLGWGTGGRNYGCPMARQLASGQVMINGPVLGQLV